MKKIQFFLILVVIIATGLTLTNCEKSDTAAVVVDPIVLKLANSATLGSYLTDKDGNALYFFAKDANGANNCTGGCTANWPNFGVTGLTQNKLGTGLLLANFDSITTPAGKQLTYKGWPLYYYAPGGVREASGQTTGEGVGGLWFIAKPDYSITLANAQLLASDGKNYVVSPTNVYSEGLGTTTYFTDSIGRTLYAFFRDSTNINKYTKADFSNNPVWPIYETNKIVVPSFLDKTLFGSTLVYGRKQLTYKGWPMYYVGTDVDALGKFRGKNTGVYGPLPTKWPIFFYNKLSDLYPAAPKK
jgi:predicted lipoprotein with Yx(FWY)xxD motif